jgi:putative intracellular protease/amidase
MLLESRLRLDGFGSGWLRGYLSSWPSRGTFAWMMSLRRLAAILLLLVSAGGPVASQGAAPRVLFVVSAATQMTLASGKKVEIGYWASELVVPIQALTRAGYEVDIATPGGVVPQVDPYSASARGLASEARAEETRKFLESLHGLKKPLKLESLSASQVDGYAGVVVPGGYAPMFDLAESKAMGRVLRQAMAGGVVVASICHGPAAFLSARSPDGSWTFKGYRMASFTNAEEQRWFKDDKMPWLVEDALKKAGARWVGKAPWHSNVVRDRNLLTAQSAPSVSGFSSELVKMLDEARRATTSGSQ